MLSWQTTVNLEYIAWSIIPGKLVFILYIENHTKTCHIVSHDLTYGQYCYQWPDHVLNYVIIEQWCLLWKIFELLTETMFSNVNSYGNSRKFYLFEMLHTVNTVTEFEDFQLIPGGKLTFGSVKSHENSCYNWWQSYQDSWNNKTCYRTGHITH